MSTLTRSSIYAEIIAYLIPHLQILDFENRLCHVHGRNILEVVYNPVSDLPLAAREQWRDNTEAGYSRDAVKTKMGDTDMRYFLLVMGATVVQYACEQLRNEGDLSEESLEAARLGEDFIESHHDLLRNARIDRLPGMLGKK